ncbi:MAG: hypothetical protein S4CHLAM81_12240 [Chlamydiales bacterium]|nr:hypothetical protein [Chlamydiales bacterium]MCH9635999.1 hypothetical protein [Chlamydiales bacterium]
MRALFLIFLALTACNNRPEKESSYTRYPIPSRLEKLPGGKKLTRPLYQAKVPIGWKAIPQECTEDTMKPNALFEITPTLQLAVHSFPTNELQERVPSTSQVRRWQRQDGNEGTLDRVHHDGFVGLMFETETTLAWSFQMDPEHYQTLAFLGRTFEEQAYFRQMRSDFTIKVSGAAEEIASHRDEIFFFANTISLFHPIPAKD